QFQSDAINRAADEGSSVFVGRTADYVLREYRNAVSVFITANMEQRIQNVCKRHNLTSNEARKYICKREEARASYYNYYTGKEWGKAESYDLCVNSSVLNIDRTVDLIASFIREKFGDGLEHIG
ncbi:MAG: cytidylate kinase-like family protein, partial [Prevotellaceae bacterium]|nr:cytidylate kinase-like family protein [Prevotellaceae bacterium]